MECQAVRVLRRGSPAQPRSHFDMLVQLQHLRGPSNNLIAKES
jgi:hypothetical protein